MRRFALSLLVLAGAIAAMGWRFHARRASTELASSEEESVLAPGDREGNPPVAPRAAALAPPRFTVATDDDPRESPEETAPEGAPHAIVVEAPVVPPIAAEAPVAVPPIAASPADRLRRADEARARRPRLDRRPPPPPTLHDPLAAARALPR